MKTSGVESAIQEMDYEIVKSDFGMEMPASRPAQFQCEPVAEYNPDELEKELEKKQLGMFAEYERHYNDGGWYFNFEIIGHEYKRIAVKMWPGSLRIYPRENQPDVLELAQITSAIEQAMNCNLHHDPIDDD